MKNNYSIDVSTDSGDDVRRWQWSSYRRRSSLIYPKQRQNDLIWIKENKIKGLGWRGKEVRRRWRTAETEWQSSWERWGWPPSSSPPPASSAALLIIARSCIRCSTSSPSSSSCCCSSSAGASCWSPSSHLRRPGGWRSASRPSSSPPSSPEDDRESDYYSSNCLLPARFPL